MKVFNKIKNWFVEEYEEEDEEEDIPTGEVQVSEPLAKKVEVPKKSFRERFIREKVEEEPEEDEVEEKEEDDLEITEVPVTAPPSNNRIITLDEEEEFKPIEEEKEEVTMEEEDEGEEDVLPSRSTRVPLVFEDDDLFQEEEEVKVEEPKKEEVERPLYRGRKESTYIESMKRDTYKQQVDSHNNTKFRPSPIISPIYGILDKNYKKEEIVSREEKMSGLVDSSIDNVRKKAYGEPKEEKEVPKEKKVNVNNEKPGVSKVTIADADEYYNDLGLAYNVDYKDMSRSNASRKKEEKEEEKNDDNLFDLIDSMYKKED